jgi:hypothetical protein
MNLLRTTCTVDLAGTTFLLREKWKFSKICRSSGEEMKKNLTERGGSKGVQKSGCGYSIDFIVGIAVFIFDTYDTSVHFVEITCV